MFRLLVRLVTIVLLLLGIVRSDMVVSRRRAFKVSAVMVRLTYVKSLLENCAIDDCRMRLEGKELALESSGSLLAMRKDVVGRKDVVPSLEGWSIEDI